MTSIITEYSTGAYRGTGTEKQSVTRRSDVKVGEGPLIIQLHGSGADGTQFSPAYSSLFEQTEALAEAGYVVMSIDAGNIGNVGKQWANPDAMTAITAAADFAQAADNRSNRPRAKSGRFGLMGWSMGGLTAVAYLLRGSRAADAAGAFCWAPALSMERHFTGSHTADINAAYGGNFATNGRPAGVDPWPRRAELVGKGPIRIVHSTDDPTTSYADAAQLAAEVPNVTLTTVTARNHFPFTGHDPLEAVDFFKEIVRL